MEENTGWTSFSANFVTDEVLEQFEHRHGTNPDSPVAPSLASACKVAQSHVQLYRKHWLHMQHSIGNLPNPNQCWPDIRAAFDRESLERQQYYKNEADRQKRASLGHRLRRKRALQPAQLPAIEPDAGALVPLPAPSGQPTGTDGAEADANTNPIVALTEDNMGKIVRFSGDSEALPVLARPQDLTQMFDSSTNIVSPSKPIVFGEPIETNSDSEALTPFSPALLEHFFSEPDLVDNKEHTFTGCVSDYAQKANYVELEHPFPDKVQYAAKCGGLCMKCVPPHELALQQKLHQYLSRCMCEISPTGKPSHAAVASLWLALLSYDDPQPDALPAKTTFVILGSSLGSWHRFPEMQHFLKLSPFLSGDDQASPLAII